MPKETIDALVKGGAASPAPPLGPALGAMKVNVANVIKEINEKTESFKGMEVPVKVIVDTDTKKFSVSVGTPPVTAMLKKEMRVEKLATVGEDKQRKMAGDISLDAIVRIAKSKDSIAGDMKARIKQVLGTCVSGGITVDGKNPRDVIREINEGSVKIA